MASVSFRALGTTSRGERVDSVTLELECGARAEVATLGATLLALELPGGVDVAPCVRTVAELENRAANPYLGATVGRVANRTAGARVLMPSGAAVELARNDGANNIHGGVRGFDQCVWRVERAGVTADGAAAVSLALLSPDGDEGFPGALEARCVYSLAPGSSGSTGGGGGATASATLGIELRARLARGSPAGAVSPVALTNHTYWNLQGARAGAGPASLAEGAAHGHELALHCSRLLPLRESHWLPTGAASTHVADASGPGGAGERGPRGVLDFRAGARVGERLAQLGPGEPFPYPAAKGAGINAFFLVDGWAPPPSLHPLEGEEGSEGAEGAGTGQASDAAAPAWPRGRAAHCAALAARLRPAAAVRDPASGRAMRVSTTCPGVQFYTNFGYAPMNAGATICLETQHPPDTANTAVEPAEAQAGVARSLVRAQCACARCAAPGAAPAREEAHQLTLHELEWVV